MSVDLLMWFGRASIRLLPACVFFQIAALNHDGQIADTARNSTPMAAEIKPIKDVLVPIDFSECSQSALRYALRIVKPCGARLHLLFVDDDPLLIQSTTDQSFRDERHAEMSKQLADVLSQQDQESYQVLPVIRVGTAYYEIEKYATEESVDMIVMGNVGRSALANALLGSVATHVIREAPCAVLSVKSDT